MLPTLSIEELKVGFAHRTGMIEAVDGVSLAVAPGQLLEHHAGRGRFYLPPQCRLGRLSHSRERLDARLGRHGPRDLRTGGRGKQTDSDQGSP